MAVWSSKRRGSISSPVHSKKNQMHNAQTAAGFKVGHRQAADTMRRLLQPWQARAFAYYDILGEIKYAAQFYSKALSKLRLYPAEIDDQGEVQEDIDPKAVAALERMQDPGGGRSNLLAQYGRLMFLVGEALLFVSVDKPTKMDPEPIEKWEFLSNDELRVMGNTYTRFKAPSLTAEQYHEPDEEDYEPVDDEHAVAYRVWRPHPRYSMLADSTMQGVLDLCEELVLLTQVIRSRARSRIAGPGVFLVPDDIGPPPLEVSPDEDMMEDPLMAEFVEAATAPIVDEGSAAAVAPIILRGSPESLKEVRHIQIIDPTQLYPETGLRMELIRRIAMGLDMPPEILLGMQDSNHWSAWQVDEQVWKAHLQPVAQYLVDDLTAAYYRPQLKQDGVDNWQRKTIAYDAAEVINHPDRGKDAQDLYTGRAIGKKAFREAKGFADDDAPSDDELAEMIGVAVRDSSLAWDKIPGIKAGGIEPTPGVIVTKEGEAGAPAGSDAGGPEVDKSAPPEPVPGEVIGSLVSTNGHDGLRLNARPASDTSADVARILGAADLALRRARELAGNKIRNYAKRDADALESLKNVSAGSVAFALGAERCKSLRCPTERDLVAGAADLLVEVLKMWGVEDEKVAGFLGVQIEQHAARTLYDERPPALPKSLENYLLELQKAMVV